jgi:hypothetical protein
MLSVFERCIEYKSEQPGDYSARNDLFSYRENWFIETYDNELLMKTGRLQSSHHYTAMKLMKPLLQSPFFVDLENMSIVTHTNDDRQVNYDDRDDYEDH